MAPGPGEKEIAQEAAKKASQVESDMVQSARNKRAEMIRPYFTRSAALVLFPLFVLRGASTRLRGAERTAPAARPAPLPRGAPALRRPPRGRAASALRPAGRPPLRDGAEERRPPGRPRDGRSSSRSRR